ncbi:MAG: NFACT RNA binding domain-containing protein [Synechococcales cyanobacterium]
MQPFDLTALRVVHGDLQRRWCPARLETVVQTDLWTLHFCLRTLTERGWITVCWHPQWARLHQGSPPPKQGDPFQFGQTLQRLRGLALVAMEQRDPWERVVEWQWAIRPGEAILWRLIIEVMGKYSNVVLIDPDQQIVACGHGVSERQSRLRPVQVGLPYDPPPPLTAHVPSLHTSLAEWQERLTTVPGPWGQRLLKQYRGVSRSLLESMAIQVGLDVEQSTATLSAEHWQHLFTLWQTWLTTLDCGTFQPGRTPTGYTLIPWPESEPRADQQTKSGDPAPLHTLIEDYYQGHWQRQQHHQHCQRLQQMIQQHLRKREQRLRDFQQMLDAADHADENKSQADLLMAYAHQEQPGLSVVTLPDFASGDPVTIALQPDKSWHANADLLYRTYRKAKRAQDKVLPLLQAVQQEISYLQSVETALTDLATYADIHDLTALRQIDQELREQGYGHAAASRSQGAEETVPFRQFSSANGLAIWVGRHNRHNDALTFRWASKQDWWFHAQEIPGSHVVLRLQPGQVAEPADLQAAADLAAYFSRARQSDQVPVVFTRPQHVFKPKGMPPGFVVYKQEKVIWGSPTHDRVLGLLATLATATPAAIPEVSP